MSDERSEPETEAVILHVPVETLRTLDRWLTQRRAELPESRGLTREQLMVEVLRESADDWAELSGLADEAAAAVLQQHRRQQN